MVHNLAMSYSPSAHGAAQASPIGWFATGIATVTVALAVGATAWSQLADVWAGGLALLVVALAAVAIGYRRGSDSLVAFLAGSVATAVGLYGAVLITAHLSVAAVRII
jgi:hypothetical protein